jgi:hypothetical protein
MDIFSPGNCLDIPYLHEQIWFDIDSSSPDRLYVKEIYDVLLRNPSGNPELSQVNIIFPHDCTRLANLWPQNPQNIAELYAANGERITDGNDGLLSVKSVRLNDKIPDEFIKFNWPFVQKIPQIIKNDKTEYSLWKPQEELELLLGPNKDNDYFTGIPLHVTPQLDPILTTNKNFKYLKILSHEEVSKTFLILKFDQSLASEEQGWFRLIVTHKPSPFSRRLPKNVPCMEFPVAYEQHFRTTCPILVRRNLHSQLILFHKQHTSEDAVELAKLISEKGFDVPGTTTRIFDHRIALVAGNINIDISELRATRAMDFYGVFQVNGTMQRPVFLFGGGADRNSDKDLVHNAKKIINEVESAEEQSIDLERLISKMAPPQKTDSYKFLIGQMADVGLLQMNEELVQLNKDVLDPDRERRLCDLRKKYSQTDSIEKESRLKSEFKDSHEFAIHYKIKWSNTSSDITDFWQDKFGESKKKSSLKAKIPILSILFGEKKKKSQKEMFNERKNRP